MKRQTDPYGKAMKNRLSVWEKIARIGKGKGGAGPFRFSLFPVPRSTKGLFTGYEEVNKTIRQKIYIQQIAQYFGLKTNLLQGLKEKGK